MLKASIFHFLHKLLDFGHGLGHHLGRVEPAHKAADALLGFGVLGPQRGVFLPEAGGKIVGVEVGDFGVNGRLVLTQVVRSGKLGVGHEKSVVGLLVR